MKWQDMKGRECFCVNILYFHLQDLAGVSVLMEIC